MLSALVTLVGSHAFALMGDSSVHVAWLTNKVYVGAGWIHSFAQGLIVVQVMTLAHDGATTSSAVHRWTTSLSIRNLLVCLGTDAMDFGFPLAHVCLPSSWLWRSRIFDACFLWFILVFV
eukprot:5053707-Amphidinium_carterae.1